MRYPGGKGKSYQHIINLMPPHHTYIETHLGGGAVLRAKRPALCSYGIDRDPRVISSWSAPDYPNLQLLVGRAELFLTTFRFRGDELVYSDPPYYPATRRRKRVYRYDYLASDHESLLEILASLPCKVILSGYQCDLYSKLLGSWNTRTYSSMTHAGVRDETLWFNFEPPEVLHDCRYIGQNFREREVWRRRMLRLKQRVSRMPPLERAAFLQWLHQTYSLESGEIAS